ncbi:hypothetical protein [Archangium sp.]|uniref:hypothetical protein n=1 Tax=Archangium sp. TaxID=1872627 RepID=UPI00389AAE5E
MLVPLGLGLGLLPACQPGEDCASSPGQSRCPPVPGTPPDDDPATGQFPPRDPLQLSEPTDSTDFALSGDSNAEWFSLNAVAGHAYRFSCYPGRFEGCTLRSWDSQGHLLTETSQSAAPVSLLLQSPQGEPFFIEASLSGHDADDAGFYYWQFEALGPDDHGNAPRMATRLEPSPTVTFTGHFEFPGDEDLFFLEAQAGLSYALTCHLPMGIDRWELGLWSEQGKLLAHSEQYIPQPDPSVSLLVSTPGRLFFSVAEETRGINADTSLPYTCTLEGRADDHGDTPATATPITPSWMPRLGYFEHTSDIDVLSAPLLAGHYYRVACALGVDGTGSACLESLQDASGARVRLESSPSQPHLQQFKAPLTGTYYSVLTQASRASVWRYQLEDLGADAQGDSRVDATPVPGTGTVTGLVESPIDQDVFSFTASEAEHVWRFGCDAASTTSPGWNLRFENDAGDTLDTALLAAGKPTWVIGKVSTPGSYFVTVSSEVLRFAYHCQLEDLGPEDHADTLAGATPLTLSPSVMLSARHETRSDKDVFSFSVQADHVYSALCGTNCVLQLKDASGTPLSPPASTWAGKLTREGTYFLETSTTSTTPGGYTLQLEDKGADDYGDTVDTATPLSVGSSITAWGHPGDVDSFSFAATAGTYYRVSCSSCTLSVGSPSGTVATVFTRLTYFESRYELDAFQTETVTLLVQGDLSGYTVKLEELGTDDHGDDAAHATPVEVGTAVSGTLEHMADTDVFALSLTAGQPYSLQGLDNLFLFVATIRAPDGTVVPRSANSFTPTLSGTHFLEIKTHSNGESRPAGPYTFQVRPQ